MSSNSPAYFFPTHLRAHGASSEAAPESCPHFPPSLDMSDESGVQVLGVRSKRTRQMSQESAEDTDQSWDRYFHPPPPPNIRSQPARLPPMRHAGDGFDFRRPAGTPAQEDDVIDLTNEPETPPQRTQTRTTDNRPSSSSRPPRFGRPILAQEVVDLDDEPDDPAEGPSSSPEVQFVSASVRPPPRNRQELEARFHAAFWGSSVHRNNPRARLY